MDFQRRTSFDTTPNNGHVVTEMTISARSTPQATLFDLPLEVRIRMLEFLFEGLRVEGPLQRKCDICHKHRPTSTYWYPPSLFDQRAQPLYDIVLPVLLISKSFYTRKDVTTTLLKVAPVVFNCCCAMQEAIRKIGKQYRHCMRTIKLTVPRKTGIMNSTVICKHIDLKMIHAALPNAKCIVELPSGTRHMPAFLSHNCPLLILANECSTCGDTTLCEVLRREKKADTVSEVENDGTEKNSPANMNPALDGRNINIRDEIVEGRLNPNALTLIHDRFSGSVAASVVPGRQPMGESIIKGVRLLLHDADACGIDLTFTCDFTMVTGLRCCGFTCHDARFSVKDMCLRANFDGQEVIFPQEVPDGFFELNGLQV